VKEPVVESSGGKWMSAAVSEEEVELEKAALRGCCSCIVEIPTECEGPSQSREGDGELWRAGEAGGRGENG
jgi:hypothetical protein